MGCDPGHNGSYPCDSRELPLHTVYLDAYNIDTTDKVLRGGSLSHIWNSFRSASRYDRGLLPGILVGFRCVSDP
jgi:hypothetical protein